MSTKSPHAPDSRRREGTWFLPGLVAAATGLTMAFLAGKVQVTEGEGSDVSEALRPETPSLVVTRLDWLPVAGEVRERLRLFDPTPLFMPAGGEKSSSYGDTGGAERPGGGVTEPEDPVLVFPDVGPAKSVPRRAAPDSPLEAAEFAASSRWFDGLARVDVAGTDGEVAASPGPRLDVYARGASARLATLELPSSPELNGAVWQPVELSVLVNAAGVLAPPVVISGSGTGEIDERVRVIVKQELLPRLRLRPGAYRLVVGP